MRINKLLPPLALTLPMLFTSSVMAEFGTIEFSFACKVLDQQILCITDGKSYIWNGYTDGSEVGDTFKFDFKYFKNVPYCSAASTSK